MLFKLDPDTKARPVGGRIRQKNESIILRAAEIEFANSGFKGASMNDIAQRADLPKANIHYYFKNKLGLYIAVLSDIIELWDSTLNAITPEDNPRDVLITYVQRKIEFSAQNPLASRIFAKELISGAPNMKEYFRDDYALWFKGRADIFRAWAAQGKIDPEVSPEHLIFLLWSATQHYADFSTQIEAALGKDQLEEADYQDAASTLLHIILKGCGIK
ncbi:MULTISPECIES: TetR/AcrR family transcriptional regulator [Marinobacterium]|uniref:Transcriptional regulator, TetR family n=2 Tax=Marinobacterium TaxID=48075 RepID=A0A1H5VAD4_9GAMM|nr:MULTISPECIES: TetR/AcrR family transcriptional regulator [Marinobacterium]TCK09223.1 TetR family transcriptional regulator [Marinobacterium mangrovicola]SEF84076.1 transcriptional regulator, TetR family [Marinobacterium lutimaris]